MISSKQHPSTLVNTSIDRVRQRLARWRRTRQKGSRIPEALWKAAVQLAGSYGLNPTARALRLDYYDLQKRFEASTSPAPVEKSSLPSFVELVPAPCRAKCPSGRRELNSLSSLDIVRLTPLPYTTLFRSYQASNTRPPLSTLPLTEFGSVWPAGAEHARRARGFPRRCGKRRSSWPAATV